MKEATTIKSDFVELYNVIGDIDLMLSKWSIDAKSKSVLVFIDFVYYAFNDLYNYKGDLFKLLGREGVDKMVAWAMQQKKALQEAFFYLEEKDPTMAERALNALYILEH